jgi:hypothetical protein
MRLAACPAQQTAISLLCLTVVVVSRVANPQSKKREGHLEEKRSHKLRTAVLIALALVVACAGCLLANKLLQPLIEELAKYNDIQYGQTNDLLVGSDGTLHVLYSVYARSDSHWVDDVVCTGYASSSEDGSWQVEPLGGRAPEAYTLLEGEDGTLHAVYSVARGPTYARRSPGGEWEEFEGLFDVSGRVGGVALDEEGAMHVSHAHHANEEDRLEPSDWRFDYSYRRGDGRFETRLIEVSSSLLALEFGPGDDSKVVIDSSGAAHLIVDVEGLFAVPTKIVHYRVEPGNGALVEPTLVTDRLSTGGLDMAIDGQDNLYVVFSSEVWDSEANESISALKLACSGDGGANWQDEVVALCDGNLSVPSVAVDSSGGVHASYLCAPGSYSLQYAYRAAGAGAWQTEEVASAERLYEASLDLDPSGRPLVLYASSATPMVEMSEDGLTIDLQLARRAGAGGWAIDTVLSGSEPLRSLALD